MVNHSNGEARPDKAKARSCKAQISYAKEGPSVER
nr:MAG TPA: hypothetical protein [Caudoviricetes sp.]